MQKSSFSFHELNEDVPILSTKKLKAAITRQALASGFKIIESEFIKISFIDVSADLNENIVFTSRNAVTAFKSSLNRSGLPFWRYKGYCLDGETFKALQNVSSIEIVSVAKDAASLADKILADKNIKEVTFICSTRRRNELPEILRKHQVSVEEIKVYETGYNSHYVEHAYRAVLFFSPSAVESFFQKNTLQQEILCFCIGATTAASAKEHTNNPIIVAAETTQESMLDAVSKFLKNK